MAFGKVPRPRIVDEYIANPAGTSWENQGPRRIVGVCIHRMWGTLNSTYWAFSEPDAEALTDFGIGGVLDGERDGEIVQYNSLTGERAPYANGWARDDPTIVTEGNGRVFYERWWPEYGVNRDLASIENSGFEETEVTPAQFESLCQLMAYIFDHHCKVSWQDFPYNPNVAEDFFAVYEHYEFSAKSCPFIALRRLKGAYLARTKGILKWYQTGRRGAPPPDFVVPVRGYPIDDDVGPPDDPEPDFRVNDWIRNA